MSALDHTLMSDFPFIGGRCLRLPKWAQREMSDLRCEVINAEMGSEVGSKVREIMRYWTGTNCTFGDDDVVALGILAGHAIRAGLHKDAALPKTLIAAIDKHLASAMSAGTAETQSGSGRKPASAVPNGETPNG